MTDFGLLMKSLRLLIPCFVLNHSLAQQTAQGLRAEYYQGLNFEKKVGARIDPEINFQWNHRHKPVPAVQLNKFSVRWSGQLYAPEGGMYFFSSVADDHIKVWIDGVKILDNKHRPKQGKMLDPAYLMKNRRAVNLLAKQWVNIEVDYHNGGGNGEAVLYWELPSYTRSQLGYQGVFRKVISAQHFRPTLKLAQSASVVAEKPTIREATSSSKPESRMVQASLKPEVATTVPTLTLERGRAVILHQVQFAQSSYELVAESYPVLDQLVALLRQEPTQRITISGHTDNVGDARLNLTLSEYRARQVANYLMQHGITINRMEIRGYGGERPIAGNKIEAERARNRRVEVVLL